MALHVSTGFAAPWTGAGKYEYDFRTEWGTEWDELFDISNAGLPRGMVNRTGYPDEHKLGKNEWLAAVITELEKEIDFGISITNEINGSNGTITINTELINDVVGDYNLVVCLTESHIIDWQKDGQTDNEFYEHNHVLRTVISDASLSSSSSFEKGEVIESSFDINLAELEQYNIDYSTNEAELGNGNAGGWNIENMSVIAYIYDNTTKEIVQVEESHLNN